MPILLEDVHQWLPNQKPIVLVDCRVILYSLLSPTPIPKEWMEAMWAVVLNKPLPWLPEPMGGYTIVVVDDYRSEEYGNNYWRNQYTDSYKGNRNPELRGDDYYALHDAIKSYLNSEGCPVALLSEVGYEADDWAGLARKIIEESPQSFTNRPLVMLTVDSDWMQLVSDKLGIYFAYAKPAPKMGRLRSEYEVLRYYYDKGINIATPRAIVDVKAGKGDASDCLPPGTDPGLIDLLNPKQPLPSHCKELLKKAMLGLPNTSEKHYHDAQQYLARESNKAALTMTM